MRKIMFRAWDKRESKMISCNGYWWEENFSGEENLSDTPGFEVMQIVGLKDIDTGVDIYEEDIVEFVDDDGRLRVAVVGWSDMSCGFMLYVTDNLAEVIAIVETEFSGREYKLLGNKYENPELLENKTTA